MNLDSVSIFLNRKEVKTVMLGLTIGQIAQYLAKKYIEKHPEILEEIEPLTIVVPDKKSTKFLTSRRIITLVCAATGGILHVLSQRYLSNKENYSDLLDNHLVENAGRTKEISRRLPSLSERVTKLISPGGGFLSEAGKKVLKEYLTKYFLREIVIAVAKHGTRAGASIAVVYVGTKIPVTTIANFVAHHIRYASPQNLPYLEDIKVRIVKGSKIYIDLCHQNFEYLFNILEDSAIPYAAREKMADKTLTQYLELATNDGRINFVICMVTLILILFHNNKAGFHLLFEALIKALREGKLSKRMARIIIRRLQRQGIPISPEFVDLAN